jgi:hypothetical protein
VITHATLRTHNLPRPVAGYAEGEEGFHRIRHYGLLASSRTKADTIAGAQADRAGGAGTAIATHDQGSGTRRHRRDGQAGSSLPPLRCPHGHHRYVRGWHDAATSSERDADRNPDRYIMMVVATISHVTAARSRCWLTPSNDLARPECRSLTMQRLSAALQDQHIHAALALGPAARIIPGSAAHLTSCPLHRCRQPNPHSAR